MAKAKQPLGKSKKVVEERVVETHSRDTDDHHIRSRAYEIWEQRGRPEGSHEDHWREAEDEHKSAKSK